MHHMVPLCPLYPKTWASGGRGLLAGPKGQIYQQPLKPPWAPQNVEVPWPTPSGGWMRPTAQWCSSPHPPAPPSPRGSPWILHE